MIEIHLFEKSDSLNVWAKSPKSADFFTLIESLHSDQIKGFDSELSLGFSDFSLVKFDHIQKRIIAKRDIFGCVPLFFKRLSESWLFSDSLNDLINFPVEINESRVENYLNSHQQESDSFTTFYTDIFQVPAGAYAQISDNTIEIKYVNYVTSEDKQSLLFRLNESVSDCISESTHIAFHVSGGLDSTGLASIAQHYNLVTTDVIHCVIKPKYKSTDESEFQKAFEEKYNTEIIKFNPGFDLASIVKNYIEEAKHPPFFYNALSLYDDLILGLKSTNCQNILSGYGGDGILGHGFEFLEELVLNQKKEEIIESITMLTHHDILKDKHIHWNHFSFQRKYTLTLLHFVFPNLKKEIFKGFRFMRWYKNLNGSLFELAFEFINRIQNRLVNNNYNNLIFKHTVNRSSIEIKQLNEPLKAFNNFQSAIFSAINETYFNINKIYNTNFRFPFLSTKVLNKSLSYTLEQKFGKGKGRFHYREELNGILPDLVKNRIGKTSFDEYFVNQIKVYLQQIGEIPKDHAIWEFVNAKVYKNLFSKLKNETVSYHHQKKEAHFVHRILNLKIWLDTINNIK